MGPWDDIRFWSWFYSSIMCLLWQSKELTIMLGLINLWWRNLMVLTASMARVIQLRLEYILFGSQRKIWSICLGNLSWEFACLTHSFGRTCYWDQIVDTCWFVIRMVVSIHLIVIHRVWLANFTAYTGLMVTFDGRILLVRSCLSI